MFNQKPLPGDLLDCGNWASHNLAGLWFFNEDFGNKVYDLSGNRNTGKFVGTIIWVAGRNEQALEFAGNADYVDVSVILGTTFTIVADIFPVNMDAWGAIAGIDENHGFLYKEATDKLTYYVGSADHESDTVIPHDTWSQVGLVRKETAIEFFLNGVSDGADTIPNTALTVEYIGSDLDSEDFKGKMGYVYFYNRALTTSEIASLYYNPFQMVRTRRRRIIAPEDIAVAALARAKINCGLASTSPLVRGLVA